MKKMRQIIKYWKCSEICAKSCYHYKILYRWNTYQSNIVGPLSLLRSMYVKSLVRYISTTRPRHQRNPSILCIHRFQFHIFYRRSPHRYHTYPGQNHDPFLSCVPSHALQSRKHKTIYMINQSSAFIGFIRGYKILLCYTTVLPLPSKWFFQLGCMSFLWEDCSCCIGQIHRPGYNLFDIDDKGRCSTLRLNSRYLGHPEMRYNDTNGRNPNRQPTILLWLFQCCKHFYFT